LIHLLDSVDSGIGADADLSAGKTGDETWKRARIDFGIYSVFAKNSRVTRSVVTQDKNTSSRDNHFDGFEMTPGWAERGKRKGHESKVTRQIAVFIFHLPLRQRIRKTVASGKRACAQSFASLEANDWRISRNFVLIARAFSGPIRNRIFWPADSFSSLGSANS